MAMPLTPESTEMASTSPEVRPAGRSICVMSPVTTTLDPGTDPGQDHLHLLGGGVLGLVDDHEGVGERPAPHEGDGRHFQSSCARTAD